MESRRILSWAVLFTGANVVVKGAYAVAVLWLASILSTESYAQFGMLYAIQSAMAAFAVFGIGETTISLLKAHPTGKHRLTLFRRMSGQFVVTSAIALALLSPFIARVLFGGVSAFATIFAVGLGAVVAFGTLYAGFHRIEERHGASLLSSAGIPLGAVAGLALGGWWFADLGSIFALGMIGAVTVLGVLIATGQVMLGAVPTPSNALRNLMLFWPFLIISIFGWLGGYGINFVIDIKFELIHVAMFTFLLTVSSVNQMVATSLNMVWAPRFYRLYNEQSAAYAGCRSRYFFALLAIALGVSGGVVVAALPWITAYVGGNVAVYGAYRFELAFLMAAYVVAIPWWFAQNYFHISGHGKALMQVTVRAGGTGLLVWLLCMYFMGVVGIFVGFAVQMLIKGLGIHIAAKKYWSLRPPWIGMCVGTALVFAGILAPAP